MSQQQQQLVKALWDYAAGDSNEISFKKGDIIKLISKCNDDWWEGQLDQDVGFFPANRVALISSVKPPEVAPRPKMSFNQAGGPPQLQPPSANELTPQSNTGPARTRGPSLGVPGAGPGPVTNIYKSNEGGNSPQPTPLGKNKSGSNPLLSLPDPQIGSSPVGSPNIAASIVAKQAMSRTRGDSVISANTTASTATNETEDDEDEDDESAVTEGPSVADIKKDGFLGRRNGGMLTLRSWKSFWVELANSYLYFYKDSQSKKKPEKRDKPKSVIDLKSCRIDNSGQLDKKKTVFAIMTSKDVVLLLQANSEAEMQSWSQMILEVPGAKKDTLDDETIASAGGKRQSESKKSPKKNTATKPKKASKADKDDDEHLTEEERRERAKNKLFSFFKSRPTMDALEERGIITQDILFGGELSLHAEKEKRPFPAIVEQCVQRVEAKGMDVVGIYRLSGNTSSIQKLRLLYIEDPKLVNFEDEEWSDINVVTGTLKLYFRELKTPLMTFEKYDAFINAAKITDFNARLQQLKELVHSLPKPNFNTLKYLIKHLVRVRDRREQNKMDAANLAIVFGPTLLRPEVEGMDTIINMGFQNSVIEALILSADSIF